MNRYTKKRRSNGVTQVYDSNSGTWILFSSLSASDARSCESLSFDTSTSTSYSESNYSSSSFSDGGYSSSSDSGSDCSGGF